MLSIKKLIKNFNIKNFRSKAHQKEDDKPNDGRQRTAETHSQKEGPQPGRKTNRLGQ